MKNSFVKYLALPLIMSACTATQGDWPSLNEPLPDISERQRITQTADPATTGALSPSADKTAKADPAVIQGILDTIQEDYQAYETALQQHTTAGMDEKAATWQTVQLYLTRLSHTVSALDPYLQTAPHIMDRSKHWQTVIVAARKHLDTLRQSSQKF